MMTDNEIKLCGITTEQALLGSILLEGNKLFEEIMGIIDTTDFYKESHQIIFRCFLGLFKKNKAIDLVIVVEELNRVKVLEDIGGVTYLTYLVNSVSTTANLHHYVKIIKDYSYKRAVFSKIGKFKTENIDTQKLVEDIVNIKKYEEVKEKTNKDIILETISDAQKGTDFKFPENFEGLNKITGGFDRGDLIIIGGYPSNGKSSLCVDLTKGFCSELGYKVLFITLEMTVKANMRRILANTQKINTMRFRHGELTEVDKDKIKIMIPQIDNIWKYNCVRAYTMQDIIRAMANHEPDIVIIDYLQNIADPENLSEYARLTKFTLQIQQAARMKDIGTILLSQFHRPQEGKVREPRNNDFRGSGSIEERAEIIFLIYWERKLKMESLSRRDDDDPEYAVIHVTKNKDGETGKVEMKLYPEYHRWISFDDKKDEKEVIKYVNAMEVSREAKKSKYRYPGEE